MHLPNDWVCFEQDEAEGGTPGMGINTLIGVGNVNPIGPYFPGVEHYFPDLGPKEITLWAASIGDASPPTALVARQSDGVVANVAGATGKFVFDPAADTPSGDEVDATNYFNVSPEDLEQNEWILGINFAGDTPFASFTYDPDPPEGASPLDVDFTDTSTNTPTSWLWEKNDGGGWVDFDGDPTAQNPTETFTTGTWSIRLTACNINGCDSHTETNLVIVAVAPVANFTGTPLSGCTPLEVTFTDSSTNTPTAWLWEKNDGGGWVDFDGDPTAQNPVEDFAVGTWSVRLTASNAGGSDDLVRTDYVEAVDAPVASFTATPLSGASPLEVTFTDTSTGTPTSWFWEKNDGSGWVPFDGTPNDQNPVEIFGVEPSEIVVTGTFTPPVWIWDGTVLDQNFSDADLDLSLAETITFVGVTGIGGNFQLTAGDETVLTSIDLSGVLEISSDIEITGLPVLTTLNLSDLTETGTISIYTLAALSDISFTALVQVTTGLSVDDLPMMISAPDFPALQSVGDELSFSFNASMTTLPSFASLLALGGDFSATDCALTEAAVDAILVKLASLNGTGGTTTWDNHSVDLSGGTNAPPSATGLAAKATLELRGNTVTVN